jgi:site-specific recombinase XerD
MHLLAHVSRWLIQNGVEPAQFDQRRVEQFLGDRRADGYVRFPSPRGLMPLVEYLRGRGVIPEPVVSVPAGPWARLLEEFVGYLVSERGLAEQTVVGYRRVAATFLSTCPCEDNGDGLASLSAVEVNAFLLTECARRSVGSANNVVVALRALLRFLYLHGHVDAPLADAVPWVATWRDGGRSRALTASQVAALLASCDRRSSAGRRDFAILTVLARLGLRAAEVASLTLDDFDWQAGEVAVAGKGNRRDRLPLPSDVGEAVAGYCRRGRPRNSCRVLFLHVRAPYTAMSSSAVSEVVRRASLRAGIAPVRAHQLRHSTASMMRRAGAPLFEIGQVLRHHHTVTTAVYAKDDLDALARIARPWPGERS